MTGSMSKREYKEYFEQNNLRGNNYETAKFIKFLMDRRAKGREIEELTGIKHSQITSYKKIIKSGKIEELKNKSISKVFKSIEKPSKLDNVLIRGIEKLNLGNPHEDPPEEEYNSSEEEEEIETWEESMERMTREFDNENTNELEFLNTELEMQSQQLLNENKRLRRKRGPEDKTIDEQQKTIDEQQKTIEELRRELKHEAARNASLLAYKKFFEEMKARVDSVAAEQSSLS